MNFLKKLKMRKSIFFFTFTLFSSIVSAQGYTLNCADSRLLFPKQILSNDKNLDVIADRSEITLFFEC